MVVHNIKGFKAGMRLIILSLKLLLCTTQPGSATGMRLNTLSLQDVVVHNTTGFRSCDKAKHLEPVRCGCVQRNRVPPER